jgi:putative ABC transport system permease protein
MNIIELQGALQLGLIYSILAIGVYLSFRVLHFPDLTVDGSFPLGAAVTAVLITTGVHPGLAMIVAAFAGGCAGLATALLSTRLKIFGLLASILVMSSLYSINLRIMGNRPNISLANTKTLFTEFEGSFLHGSSAKIYVLTALVISIILVISLFMRSQLGLALRAVGNNPRMSKAQGISEENMISFGLLLSNALVAIAGSLFCQCYGFADVTLGVGTIIIGLASLILGEALFSSKTPWKAILACAAGAVLYRVLITIALGAADIGLEPSDLNLISAALIAGFMGFPVIRKVFKFPTKQPVALIKTGKRVKV